LFQSIACFLGDLTDQLQQWKLRIFAWPCILCCVFSLYTKFRDKFDATGHSSKNLFNQTCCEDCWSVVGISAGWAGKAYWSGRWYKCPGGPSALSQSPSFSSTVTLPLLFSKTGSNLLPTITLSLVLLVIIRALH
jgi:hypothetical protein